VFLQLLLEVLAPPLDSHSDLISIGAEHNHNIVKPGTIQLADDMLHEGLFAYPQESFGAPHSE